MGGWWNRIISNQILNLCRWSMRMCLEGWAPLLQFTVQPSWSILLLRSLRLSWFVFSICSNIPTTCCQCWSLCALFLCHKVLELAGNAAKDLKVRRITPRHLQLAIRFTSNSGKCWRVFDQNVQRHQYNFVFYVLHSRGDEELDALIKATISGGGVSRYGKMWTFTSYPGDSPHSQVSVGTQRPGRPSLCLIWLLHE